ncbi:hypothetical protein [Paractinoplanes durhamensis]|uniref:AAA+ ATPase domain-containing protein n=1 Tax=Paractinoplanes durhamensis TaxID=113563 RepID=A0ABQ3ZE04_9ACTN|nr:hypothetical protein [Actinoplanes durhamensis]GIE08067.1 hypothetical protein Adu01nite_94170 [Actinoplanes durhamensis]
MATACVDAFGGDDDSSESARASTLGVPDSLGAWLDGANELERLYWRDALEAANAPAELIESIPLAPEPGPRIVLLGNSSAGKTTLLAALAAQLAMRDCGDLKPENVLSPVDERTVLLIDCDGIADVPGAGQEVVGDLWDPLVERVAASLVRRRNRVRRHRTGYALIQWIYRLAVRLVRADLDPSPDPGRDVRPQAQLHRHVPARCRIRGPNSARKTTFATVFRELAAV